MDSRVAAEYYVLYRLTQLGYLALPGESEVADLVACTANGSRVALLQVRTLEARGRIGVSRAELARTSRNRAYVFIDFAELGADMPACFVVPAHALGVLLAAAPGWPAGVPASALAPYREAWDLLGLGRPGQGAVAGASPSAPTSPSSPGA